VSLTEQTSPEAQAPEPVADTAVSPTAQTTPAEVTDSPTVETGAASGVDAVLKALETKAEVSPPSPEQPDAEAGEPAEGESEQTETTEDQTEPGETNEDLSEADLARLNKKTQARIQDLVGKSREATARVDELQAELDRVKPDIEGYRQITTWMRENDLSSQDAAQAMTLAGLIQKDPTEAYRRLYPIVADLAKQAGYVLDPDLADDVKLGRITKTHAQEIARTRAQANLSQRQAEAAQRREEAARAQAAEEQQRTRFAEHVQSISRLGDELTAEHAKRDPDWKLKEPLVLKEFALSVARDGVPKDAQDLNTRFKAAVDEATRYIRGITPAKPKANNPPMSASSPAQKLPPPKDGTEAVLRALG